MQPTPRLHLAATLGWTAAFAAAFVLTPLAVEAFAAPYAAPGLTSLAVHLLNPALALVLSLIAATVHRTWVLPLGVGLAWLMVALPLFGPAELAQAGASALAYAVCSGVGVATGALARLAPHADLRPLSGGGVRRVVA